MIAGCRRGTDIVLVFFEISVACKTHILAPCAYVPVGVVFLGAAGGKVQDYALPCGRLHAST